jgi:hypothetical protein
MSEPYWIWTPSASACEACVALAGVHVGEPPRPHPHCLCTVARVDASDMPGICLWPEPLLMTFETAGGAMLEDVELDYDASGRLVAATWIYSFQILCRDATILEITKSYRDEDPEITQWLMESPHTPISFEDAVTAEDKIMDQLAAEALDDAATLCPACTVELPGL